MKTLGICIGASSISIVGLEKKDTISQKMQVTKFHDGDSKHVLHDLLEQINLDEYDRICVTGRKFRNMVNLSTITEPEAVEHAITQLIPDKNKYNALVSAGGETILIYELDKKGKIYNVFTGNKCASGTGSFFLQQLGRMGLSIDDLKNKYIEEEAYDISGRCSVFCKSDCTHALNKGIEKDRVVAGLCKMMALKITELLTSFDNKNIIITGGISQISPIVQFVESSVDSVLVPEHSGNFEAYGAAVWAMDNETQPLPESLEDLFIEGHTSFDFLGPLEKAEQLVDFKEVKKSKAVEGQECILGVDIGSTTTKAVLMGKKDDAILASVYLRTQGDPVGAAKNCYKSILEQLGDTKVNIVGLGTTGSGRYITGIHAMTESIYNEIICHATASIYFDKEVDTIFEIGGQDAKYTYITQGIPSDYAMNEACSAGTGSFLEEAAKEALNVDVEEIADIAMGAKRPPNFNDQCSAFISSDIATAFQEGMGRDDIIAGLVYSICLNYNNRVRGARPYGKKVFMQGGVCYNKAVPIAMAALLGTKIVVPPEPGLMGAYGSALEIKKRIDKNMLEKKTFDLAALIKREISYLKPFVCQGGQEKCDRKCSINMLNIEGKKIPFGGACNKYYNQLQNIKDEAEKYDLVAIRDRMIFEDFARPSGNVKEGAKTIGINRTFLTNMLYPLYFNFWDQLGYKVVLSDDVTLAGREKRKSAFCYPAEIAHGAFDNLLSKKPDYIFMPHVTHIPVAGSVENNKACVFVQGEPYYLKQAFGDREIPELLIPVIDFQTHVDSTKEEFVKSAAAAGAPKDKAKKAFDFAIGQMMGYFKKAWEIGKKAIEEIEADKEKFGVVLLGRWYNALAKEANMSIPHKFATRGITIIPYDFVPFDYENLGLHMHWGIGKIALQVANYVKKHSQLFATYVTNFSCGPDSFVVPYFRDVMGRKPSLTLELDSHTADVGLNTRIEAALDIIRYYRQLEHTLTEEKKEEFVPAETIYKGTDVFIKDSNGELFNIKDPNVTFLFPKMGRFLTEGGVATLNGLGFHAKIVDQPNMESLGLGKANSSCKECLPYIVLAGSMVEYVQNKKQPDEKVAFFIVGDPAPCRVEQYQVGFKKIIEKNKLRDVSVLTLQSSEGFAGMGTGPLLRVWQAFCLADVMEQVYSAILALAKNRKKALEIFEAGWQKMLDNFAGKEKISIYKRMNLFAQELAQIEFKMSLEKAHRITVTGEMYVRNEVFCRQKIENTLADMGFITRITPLIEWIYYVDYVQFHNFAQDKISPFKRMYFYFKRKASAAIERKIKKIFAQTHLYEFDPIDIKKIIETSRPLVDQRLIGDVGVTIGVGLKDSLAESCGVISLGPFACIQTRMAEAILNNNMTVGGKLKVNRESVFGQDIDKLDKNMPLPYLAIESDGNPYPQIVQARLEVFALQAKRIGDLMNSAKSRN